MLCPFLHSAASCWTLTDPAGSFLSIVISLSFLFKIVPLLWLILIFSLGSWEQGLWTVSLVEWCFCDPMLIEPEFCSHQVGIWGWKHIWLGEGKPSKLQRCSHGCSLLNLFTSEIMSCCCLFFSMCEKIYSFGFPSQKLFLIFMNEVCHKSTPNKQWKYTSYQ